MTTLPRQARHTHWENSQMGTFFFFFFQHGCADNASLTGELLSPLLEGKRELCDKVRKRSSLSVSM